MCFWRVFSSSSSSSSSSPSSSKFSSLSRPSLSEMSSALMGSPHSSSSSSSDSSNSKHLHQWLSLFIRSLVLLSFSFFVGAFSLSSVFVFSLCFFLLSAIWRHRREISNHREIKIQSKLQNPKELQLFLPPNVPIPSWSEFREWEKTDFISQIIEKLWPSLKGAIELSIRQAVQPLLDTLRPSFLTALRFSQISLGNIPPTLSAVKLQNPSNPPHSDITIDAQIEFSGNPNIQLEVASTPLMKVSITLADFQLRGVIRIQLKSLKSDWPLFRAIGISFTKRPEITFTLETGAVSITSIPGLSAFLPDLVKSQLVSFLLWPKKILIPMETLDEKTKKHMENGDPQGILTVKILTAHEVKASTELFVKLVLGVQSFKSSCVKCSRDPLFDESFDFLVTDPQTEILSVALKGKPTVVNSMLNTVKNFNVPSRSLLLGDVSLNLETVTLSTSPQTVSLPLIHGAKGVQSTIQMTVTWKPFKSSRSEESAKGAQTDGKPFGGKGLTETEFSSRGAFSDGRESKGNSSNHMDSEGQGNAVNNGQSSSPPPPMSSRGLLFVTVVQCENLWKSFSPLSLSPLSGSKDIFVSLSVGRQNFRTVTVSGPSPKFSSSHQFQLLDSSDSASSELSIEVIEKSRLTKDTPIGKLRIPIISVIQSEGSQFENKKYSLTNAEMGATITITAKFKEY